MEEIDKLFYLTLIDIANIQSDRGLVFKEKCIHKVLSKINQILQNINIAFLTKELRYSEFFIKSQSKSNNFTFKTVNISYMLVKDLI